MAAKPELVDASMNPKLNGVTLPSGEIVPWAVAFPHVRKAV